MNSSSLAANKSPYQNSNSSTSTLRPRNTRLISYLDEDTASLPADDASGSAPQAPSFPSRGVSPLPSLGRPKSVAQSGSTVKSKHAHTRSTSESLAFPPSATLWDSWPSLQGIASSLLGSDLQQKGKEVAVAKPSRRRKPATTTQYTGDWGPISDPTPQVPPGSTEERLAMVQAKRREALLLAYANEGRDGNGRYKRRDSNSDFSSYMDTAEQGQDGLVYVHSIQPQDTLAGVTIKYHCQPEVFRKVNRFWPNDNIQTRKHVFLPVEACSIRGKRIDSNFDLLSSELENLNANHSASSSDYMGPNPVISVEPVSSALTHTHSPTSLIENSKHESWVQLPGFPVPTEILRLPRRTLGYFPPARRKSNSSPSRASTPKSSFDMLRHPPTHAASLNASPVRRPRPEPTRQRSSSTTMTSHNFADHLKGPGGVGTLQGLRTEAARPGPALDSLNLKFAPYLPDLAPPDGFPKTSLRPTPRATPRASTDSMRSNSSTGLGEMGGTIEGWVRKLANPKGSKPGPGRMGDLIELETNNEMEDLLDEGEDVQTPTMLNTPKAGQSTATEQSMLDERFPVRGRVRSAYAGGKDKD